MRCRVFLDRGGNLKCWRSATVPLVGAEPLPKASWAREEIHDLISWFGLHVSVGRYCMVDNLDPSARSRLMSRIRGSGTRPEMVVRRYLHRLGYRYRLHASDLPGRPDLVFRSRRIAIFVHGCYWHRHDGCALSYFPKSRVAFWDKKFAENVARDARAVSELEEAGWTVITVWECQTRHGDLEWLPGQIEAESPR